MSYVLHLWPVRAAEVPRDIEAALSLVRRLRRQRLGEPGVFPGLAQALTSRYPCITSGAAQELSEMEWAWSDGPLDGRTDDTVYAIGLRTAMLDEVLPFVVNEANARGVAVLDPQGGQAYLPGGTVLGARPHVRQVVIDDDPADRDLGRIVFDRLEPLLTTADFKPRRSNLSFKQKFAGGWHEIELVVVHFEVGFLIDSRLDAVGDLVSAIVRAWPPDDPKTWPTTTLTTRQWASKVAPWMQNGRFVAQGQAQIDGLLAIFNQAWTTLLAPALMEYRTVAGLDRLLNGPALGESLFYPGKFHLAVNVLAAYLARNPRLESICEEILAHVKSAGPGNANHIERTQACVDYVRTHPLP